MTDRVDDLESEIAELRAAVNGLTEELVETKARVRELEQAADERAVDEASFVDAEPVEAPSETTTKSDDHVEVVEHESDDVETVDEFAGSASEEDNPEESEESTDDETAESGDIIIA